MILGIKLNYIIPHPKLFKPIMKLNNSSPNPKKLSSNLHKNLGNRILIFVSKFERELDENNISLYITIQHISLLPAKVIVTYVT